MKVSGFTFIKNAVKFDFPLVESITSILPICDEFIIVHGDSEDNTQDLINSINSPKIKVFDTVWNPKLREGGLILSEQTNIALSKTTGDWCFYIQADEIVHENYLPQIQKAMQTYLDNDKVEGLLFKYMHFYGSYNYVATSRQWYRNEIRIIRNNIGIQSFKDAQGFRLNDRKINVIPLKAYIYHYGWARPPQLMQKKMRYFHTLWHRKDWIDKNVSKEIDYDFSGMDSLEQFEGTHPEVMKKRVTESKIQFNPASQKVKKGFKISFLDLFEKLTGYRIGEYKNYKIIK